MSRYVKIPNDNLDLVYSLLAIILLVPKTKLRDSRSIFNNECKVVPDDLRMSYSDTELNKISSSYAMMQTIIN